MIKQETIAATGVFQALPELPLHRTITITAMSSNVDNIKIAESLTPWAAEVYELAAGASMSIEWDTAKNVLPYYITGTAADSYQIIAL